MPIRNNDSNENDGLIAQVRLALHGSELARAAGSVKRDRGIALALGESKVRRLRSDAINRLEILGNTCDAWSLVLVAEGFDWRQGRNNVFQGDVVLGRFD